MRDVHKQIEKLREVLRSKLLLADMTHNEDASAARKKFVESQRLAKQEFKNAVDELLYKEEPKNA